MTIPTRWTIIPDVHGRSFWRKAVADVEETPVVFLGDYLDPYPQERISKASALEGFKDILALKEAHPDRVTLLLGNHDLHYILTRIGGGRTDMRRFTTIRNLLSDKLDLFDMALELESGGHRYLLTHAGVLNGWLIRNDSLLYGDAPATVGARMNYLLHDETWRETLFWALSDVGYARGGMDAYGGPVWADIHEHREGRQELEGIYQVFGHTWMEKEIVTNYWACLDCGQAFTLYADSNIIERK